MSDNWKELNEMKTLEERLDAGRWLASIRFDALKDEGDEVLTTYCAEKSMEVNRLVLVYDGGSSGDCGGPATGYYRTFFEDAVRLAVAAFDTRQPCVRHASGLLESYFYAEFEDVMTSRLRAAGVGYVLVGPQSRRVSSPMYIDSLSWSMWPAAASYRNPLELAESGSPFKVKVRLGDAVGAAVGRGV